MKVDENPLTDKDQILGIFYIRELSKKHQSTPVSVNQLERVIKALKNLGIEIVRIVVEDDKPLILTNKKKKVGLLVAPFFE